VRQNAETKAVSNLISLKMLKKEKPGIITVFAGCAAQELGDKLPKIAPHLDIVLGTKNFSRLPGMLKELENKKTQGAVIACDMAGQDCEDRSAFTGYGKTGLLQAQVPVSTGCNNYCSYCIVPYVRGREESRPKEKIIEEITKLSENGCVEVTLLGQNVNSYVSASDGFCELMLSVSKIKGIERVRFMTSHPADFKDELLKTVKDTEKICKHFHLPLQSGSDRILKAMNRKYTRQAYKAITEKIRRVMPYASITTDLIAGYPGETEEDFNDTLNLLNEIKFDSAYCFKYSPRPGTEAAKIKDNVPPEVKSYRLQRLNKITAETAASRNLLLSGRKEKVLVESFNSKNSTYTGRTDNFKLVMLSSKTDITGKFVDVEITETYPWILAGKIIE